LLAAQFFLYFIKVYFTRWTARTRNNLDDRIIKIISRPVYLAIFFTGLYIAVQNLTIPDKWSRWTDRTLFIILVIIAATVLSRLLLELTSHWLRVEKRYERTPKLVGKIISILIYLIAFIMVLNHFDINITPIVATLGIGGLAAGLALQSTLSNFFAGLHIITDRSFTVGDLIEINQLNVTGNIEDIGWRTTRIKTLQNTIAIVPNSKIAESVIINTELPERESAFGVNCGVDYASDLEKVEQIVMQVARNVQQTVEGAVKDYEPNIRYGEFGESNILFSVALKVHTFNDKALVKHEFIKRLKIAFDAERIFISFPVRRVIS
jgi:small-conductance mechanosensitive channel